MYDEKKPIQEHSCCHAVAGEIAMAVKVVKKKKKKLLCNLFMQNLKIIVIIKS